MNNEVNLDTVLADTKDIFDEHLNSYLVTGGKIGHNWDTRPWGGVSTTTALVLKVIGRKSGRVQLVTLVYAPWGDEYVIIGSKAGAPEHPAWYLNLVDRPQLEFQIGGKCWQGTWREAEREERERIWSYILDVYPPYRSYQEHTERLLPVVLLKPGQEVALLKRQA